MRPFPSPRQVQSSIIQPWYGFSQVSPTRYEDAALLSKHFSAAQKTWVSRQLLHPQFKFQPDTSI